MQSQLQKLAVGLLGSQDFCEKARLPWRRGAFLYGPPGVGKSAAGRAIALLLGWQHITVPAHELIDTHHLTRALFECTGHGPAVIVLENIDALLRRMDASTFFDLFDAASERASGVFWIVTSRRPEEVPKNQFVRPGRFEEILRFAPPAAEVKRKYYETYLAPFLSEGEGSEVNLSKDEHLALLDSNENLTFSHLQEMRLLVAKVLMDGEPDKLANELRYFCQEQAIAGDRVGGASPSAMELEERVKLTDPRLLTSALQVTDAFKRVVEATIANAAEALAAAKEDSGSSS